MLVTPGSTHDALVLEVDVEDALHAREHDQDARRRSAARRRTGRSPRRAPRTARRRRAHARTTAWTSSALAGSTAAAGHAAVLEQPVGLVGPQLVLLRVDPLVADGVAQLGDERRQVTLLLQFRCDAHFFPTTIQSSTAVDCR